jgi:hypothetical protein
MEKKSAPIRLENSEGEPSKRCRSLVNGRTPDGLKPVLMPEWVDEFSNATAVVNWRF